MVGVAALTDATQGTVRVSRLAIEVKEVQSRIVRSRAVVLRYAEAAPLLGEQAAAAECQRYARLAKVQ